MKKLLVFVVLLAVGAGAAYHFGLLDRLGLGANRVIPKDPNLLAYFGPDSRELLLLQVTELDLRFSDEEQRRYEQDWKDFHAKTGINVAKDVDAVALADGLGAARGRFDWKKLSAYLQTEGYTLTELAGVPGAVKSAAPDLALDGNYLLMGPRGTLERAIARKRQGAGLNDNSALVKAIDELGWKHSLVGGVVSGSRLADESTPSQMKKMQSVLGAIDSTESGVELRAIVATGSKEESEALHATLEVMRKAIILEATVNPLSETRPLRDPLEKAVLEVDAQGRLRGTMTIPYAAVGQASANLSPTQLANATRTLGMEKEVESPAPSAQPSAPSPSAPSPSAQPVTPVVAAPFTPDWKPPVLGLFLLVLALITKSAAERPGLFNVLLHPVFLVPFLVSTLGVFVFRWTGHSGGMFDIFSMPMPEWHRFLSLEVAHPVGLSAAIPMVFAIISGPVPLLRRFAAGLGVGFSAYLAVKAFGGASVPLIPAAYTLYWYAGNALAALLMARITLPSRRRAQSGGAARPARPAR
ncbi:MAG TPA: hypothetical protein VK539_13500 [Myxococcaceae bacterium]|nr:hypothetical protein [Myxococcaceae bacterium]